MPQSPVLPAAEALALRIVAAGARETGEVAFTAKVVSMNAEPPSKPAGQPGANGTARQQLDVPAPPAEPKSASAGSKDETTAVPEAAGAASTTARRQPEQPPGDKLPQVNPDAVMRALSHPATSGSAQPAAPPAGGGTATEASEASQRPTLQPDVDPPKHPAAVREIRLELSGNDQRVEVKLSDRAGELQVAVRTGDSQLADRLRENLPTLSSRLEQGGMRAETWHPVAAAAGDWRQTEETSTASGGQPDTPSQHQGHGQGREHEAQRPRALEEDQQSKEKGKDFEWFLSTTH